MNALIILDISLTDIKDGTEIGRGTSMPLSTLSSLESGSSISFSGKEIEIMEEIRKEAVAEMKNVATIEKSSSAISFIVSQFLAKFGC